MSHRETGYGNSIVNTAAMLGKESFTSDDEKKGRWHKGYFTEFTAKKAIMYTIASMYVLGCGLASVAELFLNLPCEIPEGEEPIKYPNAAYDGSRCPYVRYPALLGMNKTECSFGRRLVMAILMGGMIGWERRQADRPAGIRTMSLVSLGSCLFTINSAYAFIDGPETWDSSRISAAIPSGVGFLGAGLIFKKTNTDDNMVVHGLTTAASVWLSAAVGIACGGELYFAASFGVCLMMMLLRFGPRGSDTAENDNDDEDDDQEDDEDDEFDENQLLDSGGRSIPGQVGLPMETTQLIPGQQRILKASASSKSLSRTSVGSRSLSASKPVRNRKTASKRSAANLGSIV